jgi:hypothetical protein
MGMTRVSNLKPRAALLVVGLLLATLFVLALSACGEGGSEGGNKARPLPDDPEALSPGKYYSTEFKPPLSFEVGESWEHTEKQRSDWIELGWEEETGALSFANVEEVFKPGTMKVVDAPQDLVGWLQEHPYLKTSKPQPVTIGGVKAQRLDVVVDHMPEDYYGNCGMDCLDIFNQGGGEQIGYFNAIDRERRVFVFEDVKGETVVIWLASEEGETFDRFAPEAQKVVDSVKWRDS